MLLSFFSLLKRTGIPVSIRELLDLLRALEAGVVFADIEEFYLLARTVLVKDEKYYDRFDRAFSAYFKQLENIDDIIQALIPDDWLRKEFERQFSDAEKAEIESLGGLEKIIEEFKKRLEEQHDRHQGGNKWIGTGGTSPFGHGGYNPEGVRVGGEGGQKRAVKVWDQRQFQDLDDSVEIGTRNIKVALRRLRQFARQGSQEELDLADTIRSTARNAGMLDIKMVPERHNAVKVLLFFDVGGSMDPYVRLCEELFSAARTEFKHLEYFYFHNCLYDYVWRNNHRRQQERIPTHELLRTYAADYKVIVVGDASMAPYEITSKGGSVEYFNEEPGAVWLRRLADTYSKLAWINPVAEKYWGYTPTIDMVHQLVEGRMYPMTLEGLQEAIGGLSK